MMIDIMNQRVSTVYKKVMTLILLLLLGIGLTSPATSDDKLKKEGYPLEAGFIGNDFIYLSKDSEIKNDLNFYIYTRNNSFGEESKPVPALAKSALKIFFEYGKGEGDLTSIQGSTSFDLNPLRLYRNRVEIKKIDDSSNPFWKVYPRSDYILQGGSNNRIELRFSGITSNLRPGLTMMHIEYTNIPGYQDGRISLPVEKKNRQPMLVKYGLNVGAVSVVDKEQHLQINGGLKLQKGGVVDSFTDDASFNENSRLNVPTEKAVKTYVDNRLPAGVIVMWAGDIDKIPQGWALCDGNNGTPDLRNTFILGNGKRGVNSTGGAETVQLTLAQMPQHTHTGKSSFKVKEPGFINEKIFYGAWPSANRNYSNKANPVTLNPALKLNPAGSGQPHDNMPPFYVLAYIMKQ